MKRVLLLLVGLPLGLIIVVAAVLGSKQNPITVTIVDPAIEPILPEMADIPAGAFQRGNPGGTDFEKPVRTIHVSAFRIGKYEVTNDEWKRFAMATGRIYPVEPLHNETQNYFMNFPRSPVVEISWEDAAAYCMWLSMKTGRDFHLPTEAQWEKAARGGLDGMEFFWGNDRREGMAQMNLSWDIGQVDVGSFPPNGYGMYDVAGNVNEMVQDWYREDYFADCPDHDPVGPSGLSAYLSLLSPTGTRSRLKGRCKVIRGGSYRAPWSWGERNPDNMIETPVQVGAREYVYQRPYTHFDLGFRVAEGGVWK